MGIPSQNGGPSRRRLVVSLAGCLSCGLLALFALEPGLPTTEAAEDKGIIPCIMVCPSDIITSIPCDAATPIDYPAPTFTGVCERMGYTYSPPEGTFLGVGTHPVLITADNGDTCTFNVIISATGDTTPPVITCPGSYTVSTDPGSATVLQNYAVTATDNCTDIPSIEQQSGLPSGSLFPLGTTTNAWRATDMNGNISTCQFSIIVIDLEPPAISCPADIVAPNDPGVLGAVVDYDAVTATDNDLGFPTIIQQSGLPSGSLFPVGETTQTWQAQDGAGNTSQCSFKVTVVGPAINVKKPNDTIVFRGINTPVRWNSKGDPGDVRIELRRNGDFVRIIKTTTPNDGKQSWQVPANLPEGGGYTVRIGSLDFPAVFDDNSKAFRVRSLN